MPPSTWNAVRLGLAGRLALRGYEKSSSPVDSWSGAHITANNFLLSKNLDQNRLSSVGHLHQYFILDTAFNLSQKLLLPLNLVDSLAVDVLNVKVLSRDQQGSLIRVIEGVVARTDVLGQTVVHIGLLQTVNCVGLRNLVGVLSPILVNGSSPSPHLSLFFPDFELAG